jgi:PAS domain S-box-containing protein
MRVSNDSQRQVELDDHVEREVQAALARRLLVESLVGELAHLVLLMVVAGLVWGSAPPIVLTPWLAAVAGATIVRAVVRRRLAVLGGSADYVLRMIRHSVIAGGLAWGAGAALVGPSIPFEHFALIMVVFAGLTAGATATLIADPRSFYAFMAALLGPLALGILASGQTRSHLVAIVLIALFAATMFMIYRRGHLGLIAQLAAAVRLEFREAEAARERGFPDALLISAPNAIVTTRHDGRILAVNPAFETLFGFTAEEAIGHDLNELIVPETTRGAARELDERVEGSGTIVTEVTRRDKEGRAIPVRASAARVHGTEEDVLLVLYDESAICDAGRRRPVW